MECATKSVPIPGTKFRSVNSGCDIWRGRIQRQLQYDGGGNIFSSQECHKSRLGVNTWLLFNQKLFINPYTVLLL